MARRRLTAGLAIGAAVVTVAGVGTAYAAGSHGARTDRAGTVGLSASTTCSVQYVVRSQQRGRFTADLTVTGTPRSAWKLGWTYPSGQHLRWVRGADWQQQRTAVTVRGARGSSGTVRLSLAGTFTGTNPAPKTFTLDGVTCTTGTPTPPPTTTSAGPVPTTVSATSRPPATSTVPSSAPPTISQATTSAPTSTSSAAPTSSTTRTTTSTTSSTTRTTTSTTRTTTSSTPSTTVAPGGVLGTGRIQFGRTYTGDGTFYGATGEGNCMFDRTGDLMVAAMNAADYDHSAACGAFVQATGPKGTVTVRIVDQCPECKAGDIDFSAEAFAKIADPVAGRVRISWQLLSPALSGPISYRHKEGSSQWWCGIQIRNHRNPVRSVEALVGSSWQQLPRQDYNYFLSADGSGCGKPLRVTDIYGNQVTESAPVPVAAGVVRAGSGQFGPPR